MYINFYYATEASTMATVTIPASLYKKLAEKGVDVESLVVELLLRQLNFDPSDVAEIHAELAEKFLEEGKALLDKDPVQASEKLYKAAEEAVKAAAYRLGLSEVINRVEERGRWTVTDLEKAARAAARVLGEDVYVGWDRANYLHVWGFHEAKLDPDAVRERIPHVERVVELAKSTLGKPQKR